MQPFKKITISTFLLLAFVVGGTILQASTEYTSAYGEGDQFATIVGFKQVVDPESGNVVSVSGFNGDGSWDFRGTFSIKTQYSDGSFSTSNISLMGSDTESDTGINGSIFSLEEYKAIEDFSIALDSNGNIIIAVQMLVSDGGFHQVAFLKIDQLGDLLTYSYYDIWAVDKVNPTNEDSVLKTLGGLTVTSDGIAVLATGVGDGGSRTLRTYSDDMSSSNTDGPTETDFNNITTGYGIFDADIDSSDNVYVSGLDSSDGMFCFKLGVDSSPVVTFSDIIKNNALATLNASTYPQTLCTVGSGDVKVVAQNSDGDVIVYKFGTDLSLDTDFGTNGMQTVDVGTHTMTGLSDLARSSDGYLYIVGVKDSSKVRAFRLDDVTGSLVTTGVYATTGFLTLGESGDALQTAYSPQVSFNDGTVTTGVVGYPSSVYTLYNFVETGAGIQPARDDGDVSSIVFTDTDGTPDKFTIAGLNTIDEAGSSMNLASGKNEVVTFMRSDTDKTFYVSKTDASYDIDTDFGTNGTVAISLKDGFSFVSGRKSKILYADSDTIYLAFSVVDTSSTENMYVLKLDPDTGSIDTTLNGNIGCLKLDTDGSVYAGSTNTFTVVLQDMVVDWYGYVHLIVHKTASSSGHKYLVDYKIDSGDGTVSSFGLRTSSYTTAIEGTFSATAQDQVIYLAGFYEDDGLVCFKYWNGGSDDDFFDSTFSTTQDGTVILGVDSFALPLMASVVPRTNGVLVAYADTDASEIYIQKRKTDGSANTSYGTDGIATIAIPGTVQEMYKSLLNANNDTYTAGLLEDSDSNKKAFLTKINANGKFIDSFEFDNAGTILFSPTTGSIMRSGGWLSGNTSGGGSTTTLDLGFFESSIGAESVSQVVQYADAQANFASLGTQEPGTGVTAASDATDYVRISGFADADNAMIDSMAVVSDDTYDYTLVRSDEYNKFYITKTDSDGLVTDFGDDGMASISVVRIGSSDDRVMIPDFDSLIAGQKTIVRYDSVTSELVIAFSVTVTSDSNNHLYYMRVDTDTGNVNKAVGLIKVADSSELTLQDVQISSGKVIVLTLIISHTNQTTLYQYNSSNSEDTSFNGTGTLTVDDLATAVDGMALGLDTSGNIYVAGQLDTRQLFCMKMSSAGVIDSSGFGTSGLYSSTTLSGQLSSGVDPTPTFVSVDSTTGKIKLSALGSVNEVIIQQLNSDGTLDSSNFGTGGTETIENDDITNLTGFARDASGRLFFSGTYGIASAFIAKVYADGDLRGYFTKTPTSGSDIESTTAVNIDSSTDEYALLAFAEKTTAGDSTLRVARHLASDIPLVTTVSDETDYVRIEGFRNDATISSTVIADGLGSYFTIVRVLEDDTFYIVKTDTDGLVTTFGDHSNGLKKISFGATGSGATAEIADFSALTTDQDFKVAIDSGNLVLAFAVTSSADSTSDVYYVRISGDTGEIVTNTGSYYVNDSGVLSLGIPGEVLQDVSVFPGSSGPGYIAILTYRSSSSVDQPVLYYYTSTDTYAVSSGAPAALTLTSSLITNAALGMSLTIDGNDSNNCYIVGQTAENKLFSIKIKGSGSIDTGFGESGIYLSDDLTGKIDGSNPTSTFVSIDSANNILRIATFARDSNEILIQEVFTKDFTNSSDVSFEGGTIDTNFGDNGTATISDASITGLTGMAVDGSSNFFFSGVYGTTKSFIARVHSNGNLDTDFEERGYYFRIPTSGSTLGAVTAVGVDSADDGYAFLNFLEEDSGNDTIVRVDRILNADTSQIAVTSDDTDFVRIETFLSSDNAKVDSLGVVSDASGNSYTFARSDGYNKFYIVKTNVDGIDTDFGGAGMQEIEVGAVGSGHPIEIPNFTGFVEGQKSIMKYDSSSGDLILAFAVSVSTDEDATYLYYTRIDSATGLVNITIGSASLDDSTIVGAAEVDTTGDATELVLEDLAVFTSDDVPGYVVILAYRSTSEEGDEAYLYGFDAASAGNFANVIDGSFSGRTYTAVSNAVRGMSLALDSSDNIFVGGQTADDKLFCIKLSNVGLIVSDFNTTGSYLSSVVTSLSDTLISVDSTSSKVQLAALVEGTSANEIMVQQLSLTGALDTDFGDSGTATIENDSMTGLTNMVRDGSNNLFLSGVYGDTNSFVVKVHSNGVLDTDFGARGLFLKDVGENESRKIEQPTSVAVDSSTGPYALLAFVEKTSGDNYRLRNDRTISTDPSTVTVTSDPSTDYVKFVEADSDVTFSNVEVVSDASGNDFTLIQASDGTFYIVKTDENGLVDGFANNGIKKISVGVAGSGETIEVGSFDYLIDGNSRLAIDNDGDLVLVFMLKRTNHVKLNYLYLSRISSKNGAVDETGEFAGSNRIGATLVNYLTGLVLKDVKVNSSGQTIILCYRDQDVRGYAYLFAMSAENELDAEFNGGSGYVTSGSYVNNAASSMSLDIDSTGYIYIAGQTLDNELFCMKFTSAGVLAGTFNNDTSVYKSSGLSTQLDGTTRTFIDADSVGNEIHLATFAPTSSAIITQKFDKQGILDTDFGVDGTAAIANSDIDYMTGFARDDSGNFFFSGVDSGDNQAFVVKLFSNGNVDGVFGTRGYLFEDATSGSTIQSLTSVAIDPSEYSLLAYIEKDSTGVSTLKVDRTLTTDPSTITVTSESDGDHVKIVDSDSAATIDSLDVASDSLGNDFTMSRSGNKFNIVKTNRDGLVDGFGNGGVLEIYVGADGSGEQIEINNFEEMIASQDSLLAVDNDDNLVLAFAATENSESAVFYSRLDGSTGELTLSRSPQVGTLRVDHFSNESYAFSLQDLMIDAKGRVLILAYRDNGSNQEAVVYRYSTTNYWDNAFGSQGRVLTSSYVDNAFPGMSFALGTDASDSSEEVIYVAGQTEDYKFFCFKLDSAGDFDTDFNDGAVAYVSDDLSTEIDGSTRTFISADVNETVGQIQISALATVPATNEIIIQQLDPDNPGELDTDFGTSGTSTIVNGSITGLTGFAKDGSGHSFFSGVYGTANSFMAKVYSNGSLDDTFGSSEDGYELEDPTDGSTIEPKTAVSIDPEGYAVLAFEEKDGSDDYVLRVERALNGADPASPVVPVVIPAPTGGNKAIDPLVLASTTDIAGANVWVNDEDETYLSFKLEDQNKFRIARFTPNGDIDTTFGPTTTYGTAAGVVTVLISATQATGDKTINIENFDGLSSDSQSHMKYDSINNKLYLTFKAEIDGGDPSIYLICLDGDTGLVDTTFADGTGVLKVATSSDSTFVVEDLVIDSTGRIIVGIADDDDVSLFRCAANGTFDNAFGISGKVAVLETDGGTTGFSLALDNNDNIYVAGHGADASEGSYKFYCKKYAVIGGAEDEDFDYLSAENATLSGGVSPNTQKVFMSLYQYQDLAGNKTENIQLVTTDNDKSYIVVQQINIADGTLDTTFGTNGTSEVTVTGLTTLNSAIRNKNGQLFIGGTLTLSSVDYGFVSRLTKKGAIDTGFGESNDAVKSGTVNIPAGTGWVIDQGTWFGIDTGSLLNAVVIEEDSELAGVYRPVHYNLIGNPEHYEEDLQPVIDGDDFVAYTLAFITDDTDSLKAYVDLIGIMKTLKADWLAVDGVTDSIVATALPLFEAGITSAFDNTVTSSVSNGAEAVLGIPHRSGALKHSVNSNLKASTSLTDTERGYLTAGVNTAISTIITRIDAAFARILTEEILTVVEGPTEPVVES